MATMTSPDKSKLPKNCENTTDIEGGIYPIPGFQCESSLARVCDISSYEADELKQGNATTIGNLTDHQQLQLAKQRSTQILQSNRGRTTGSIGSYDFRTLPSVSQQQTLKEGFPRNSSIASNMNCTVAGSDTESDEDQSSQHSAGVDGGSLPKHCCSRKKRLALIVLASLVLIVGIAIGVRAAKSKATGKDRPIQITEGTFSSNARDIPSEDKDNYDSSSSSNSNNNSSADFASSPTYLPSSANDEETTPSPTGENNSLVENLAPSPITTAAPSNQYGLYESLPTNSPSNIPTEIKTQFPTLSPVRSSDTGSSDYDSDMETNEPSKKPTPRPTPSSVKPTARPTPSPVKTPQTNPTANKEIDDDEDVTCIKPASETPSEGIFYPLECNQDLDSVSCTSWTSMFTDSETHASEIVIPCGKCITMDYSGSSLKLNRGLDIQGRLVLPNGYSITIETPYVRVQGELEMISTKKVDGQEAIRIILTGNIANQFIPADNNIQACGPVGCDVGKKPIVVAGGKLDIRGIRSDAPTWVHLHDVSGYNPDGTVTSLIVRDDILGTWGEGAEVLITSHTINYDDEQVRTISTISQHADDGYVVVELDSPILRPSTVVDNPDFAVEVALLSRNIVFEGAKDDTANPLHGGHLIVLHTPTVKQRLEGVELTNFGQQGNLGRYPIHFHMSHDVCGSVVSKNLIRESNQRCIVVHGSHNLKVDSNVAYDTAGHCFITEDGNEQGNVFRRNLGALTRRVVNLIPNLGSNGLESDNEPATFWATNPSNIWEDNVAAGSERSGYWFELEQNVRGPSRELATDIIPMKEPLTLFKNNVAHSNGDMGLRTYPSGYVPDEQAVFFNTRSYKNKNNGVFIHNSRNLAVVGGVYADNSKQLDIDSAEQIHIRDAAIIGFTSEYRDLVSSQDATGPCGQGSKPLIGMELHTYTRQDPLAPLKEYGTVVENVDVRGFVGTGCSKAVAFQLDSKVETKHFDYFSSVSGVTVEDGTAAISFCEAEAAGVTDIFITDIDSSLRPKSSSYSGTSSLVSSNDKMTAFLDTSRCTEVSEGCYTYCGNTCLRSVTYQVNSAGTGDYKLQVCDRASERTCVEVVGKYYNYPSALGSQTRYFGIALPPGSYDAVFLDINNKEVLPTFVEEIYEEAQCDDSLEDGSIDLKTPTTDLTNLCEDLIKNGDAEASNTIPSYWVDRSGGIELKPGFGLGGSNAFAGIERVDKDLDGISQYLDSRCIGSEVGNKYELFAWIKLLKDGKPYPCNVDKETCPDARLTSQYLSSDKQMAKIFGKTVRYNSLSEGFFLLEGQIEITEEMADASSVQLEIRRNSMDVDMIIDNVSMVRVDQSSNSCENMVSNGKIQVGDSRFWQSKESTSSIEVVKNGFGGSSDYALKVSGGTPFQDIRTGCLEVDERYVVTSKFKLLNDDVQYACDNESKNPGSSTKCPSIRLRSGSQETYASQTFETIGFPSDSGWSTISGVFTATPFDVNADSIRLAYEDVLKSRDLIVDEVSVSKLPMDCSELVMNGDMELGFPSFWKPNGDSGIFSHIDGLDSPTAIRYSGNSAQYEESLFDYRCLKPGSRWKIGMQIKLLGRGTENGASCQLDETNAQRGSCPSINISLNDASNPDKVVLNEELYSYVSSTWNSNSFNKFESTFEIPTLSGNDQFTDLKILVRGFNSDKLDIALDDFSIEAISN